MQMMLYVCWGFGWLLGLLDAYWESVSNRRLRGAFSVTKHWLRLWLTVGTGCLLRVCLRLKTKEHFWLQNTLGAPIIEGPVFWRIVCASEIFSSGEALVCRFGFVWCVITRSVWNAGLALWRRFKMRWQGECKLCCLRIAGFLLLFFFFFFGGGGGGGGITGVSWCSPESTKDVYCVTVCLSVHVHHSVCQRGDVLPCKVRYVCVKSILHCSGLEYFHGKLTFIGNNVMITGLVIQFSCSAFGLLCIVAHCRAR